MNEKKKGFWSEAIRVTKENDPAARTALEVFDLSGSKSSCSSSNFTFSLASSFETFGSDALTILAILDSN